MCIGPPTANILKHRICKKKTVQTLKYWYLMKILKILQQDSALQHTGYSRLNLLAENTMNRIKYHTTEHPLHRKVRNTLRVVAPLSSFNVFRWRITTMNSYSMIETQKKTHWPSEAQRPTFKDCLWGTRCVLRGVWARTENGIRAWKDLRHCVSLRICHVVHFGEKPNSIKSLLPYSWMYSRTSLFPFLSAQHFEGAHLIFHTTAGISFLKCT